MRKLLVVKKLRPFLPVIVGLSLGISLSIIRIPITHEDCVHLSKDHIDRKLSSIDNQKVSSWLCKYKRLLIPYVCNISLLNINYLQTM